VGTASSSHVLPGLDGINSECPKLRSISAKEPIAFPNIQTTWLPHIRHKDPQSAFKTYLLEGILDWHPTEG